MSYRQPFRGEYPITQKYGEIIPGVTFNGKPHTGIDYGCPTGTPILASNDGTVMAAGWDLTGYGFRVILQHPDGRATLYAHLDSISVNPNEKVTQGDEIGLSGATGGSSAYPVTGPHLHFEARYRWNDWTSHFPPYDLPLMTVDDSIGEMIGNSEQLKGAEAFSEGDLLKVQNTLGVKAFFDPLFSYERVTSYPQGTPFYYTGDTAINRNNGLTYMRVIPAQFSVWVAVNDGETQLLDK